MFGTFTWGGLEIDLDAIPDAVKVGLMQRTLAHKLGNEVAAQVFKEKEKALAKAKANGHGDDVTIENVLDDDEEEQVTADFRRVMLDRILDGTVGLRVVGPRGSVLETIAFELAFAEAKAKLTPKGYWPEADRKAGVKAEDAVVEFAGGPKTREMLAELSFEKHKERFLESARKVRDERLQKQKAAKAAKEAAKGKVSASKEVEADELL